MNGILFLPTTLPDTGIQHEGERYSFLFKERGAEQTQIYLHNERTYLRGWEGTPAEDRALEMAVSKGQEKGDSLTGEALEFKGIMGMF